MNNTQKAILQSQKGADGATAIRLPEHRIHQDESARKEAQAEHCDPKDDATGKLAETSHHDHHDTSFDVNAVPDDEVLYNLADLFKVFSDSTRIKILYALLPGEKRVADIVESVGATQSAVSHQLSILKQSRLVKYRRDGKNILYSLDDDHVFTIMEQGINHIQE